MVPFGPTFLLSPIPEMDGLNSLMEEKVTSLRDKLVAFPAMIESGGPSHNYA